MLERRGAWARSTSYFNIGGEPMVHAADAPIASRATEIVVVLGQAHEAIADLADKSDRGKLTIRVEGTAADGYDPSWLRNAVEEALAEADVERVPDEK